MDWTFLLIDALPLLAFAVVDSLGTTRKAVAAALALAGLATAYDLYLFGRPDEFSLISLGLIVLFGGLALKYDNPVYFKFKPAVLSAVSAVVLLGTWWLDSPLLVSALDRYADLVPAPLQAQTRTPVFRQIMALATLYLGLGFALHAAAVAWAALRLGTWGWFFTRLVGGYAVLFGSVLLAASHLRG